MTISQLRCTLALLTLRGFAHADYVLTSTYVGTMCGQPPALAIPTAVPSPSSPILNVAYSFGCEFSFAQMAGSGLRLVLYIPSLPPHSQA